MKIAAITSGKNTPSTRFRVRQYIRPLAELGMSVKEYFPLIDKNAGLPSKLRVSDSDFFVRSSDSIWRAAKLACRLPGIAGSHRADVTWLSRELLPGYFTLENMLARPIVFDVDDAIWHARPFGTDACRKIAKLSQAIVVCNDYLANWFSGYNSNIHIVPTSIDTDRFTPADSEKAKSSFVVGWTGTAGNLHYLYRVEDALYRFLSAHDAMLLVVSDRPPRFQRLKKEWVRFVAWSPDTEASVITEMDVGLMPLPDTEWSRGKCAFKLLQYLSCGVPCIASPVGMNLEVMNMDTVGIPASTPSDFYEALRAFYSDMNLRLSYGAKGRALVENIFSTNSNTPLLANIFESQR